MLYARGWSPSEVDLMEKVIAEQRVELGQSVEINDGSAPVIQSVSLGPLVLRAETAAVSSIGAVMMHADSAAGRN